MDAADFLAFFLLAFFLPFFADPLATLRFLAIGITSFLARILHHHGALSKEIYKPN